METSGDSGDILTVPGTWKAKICCELRPIQILVGDSDQSNGFLHKNRKVFSCSATFEARLSQKYPIDAEIV